MSKMIDMYNIEEFVLVQDFDGRIRSCQMHHLTIVKYHGKMQEKESKFTLYIEYMSNDRERDAQLNIQIYQTQQFELQQFGAGMCTGYMVLVLKNIPFQYDLRQYQPYIRQWYLTLHNTKIRALQLSIGMQWMAMCY